MLFVLDQLPWGFKYPGVTYWKNRKINVYEGDFLPPELRPYAAADFSYAQMVQDELNGYDTPYVKPKNIFAPHEHQVEGGKKIYQDYRRGWPQFLLGDGTGVGKTLTSLVGAAAIGKSKGFHPDKKGKLLIVCPKSVIPQWRQTLQSYPAVTSVLKPLVLNYHGLNKLVKEPSQAKKAKRKRTKSRATALYGSPKFRFDVIIFDEAHTLKNYPSSAMSLYATTIGFMNKEYQLGKSPFIILSTATPGSSPLHFSLYSGSLSKLWGESPLVTPKQWASYLQHRGFAVNKGKTGYTWAPAPWYGKNSDDPAVRAEYEKAVEEHQLIQKADAMKIGRALAKPVAPFIKRQPKDLAGWPEQQVIGLPLELSAHQWPIYQEAWTRFRQWLSLNPRGTDPKGALVERLRYRQKASLLKTEAVAEMVSEWVKQNNEQVFISCEFTETIEKIRELLEADKIPVSVITGATQNREEERIKFQKGESKVVLATPVAGLSFHAGETLPDGTKATTNTRVTVLFDVRQNPLDSIQALGRCHRDGQNSRAYIPYFVSTVDELVVGSFVNKDTNMKLMTNNEDFMDDVFRDTI